MAKFSCVHILETENGQHHYVGLTEDLRRRLDDHLTGRSPHTSKYGPWRVTARFAEIPDHENKAALGSILGEQACTLWNRDLCVAFA